MTATLTRLTRVFGILAVLFALLPGAVALASPAPSPSPAPHRITATSAQDPNNPTDCNWQGSSMTWTKTTPQSRWRGWTPPTDPVFCLRDTSTSPGHRLVWQYDGNLVLYMGSTTGTYCPLWSSGTYNMGAWSLAFQTDGNIVIRDVLGVPIWNSHSADSGTMWQITVNELTHGEMFWREWRLLPSYKNLVSLWGSCP
jgi:hypothetical protein